MHMSHIRSVMKSSKSDGSWRFNCMIQLGYQLEKTCIIGKTLKKTILIFWVGLSRRIKGPCLFWEKIWGSITSTYYLPHTTTSPTQILPSLMQLNSQGIIESLRDNIGLNSHNNLEMETLSPMFQPTGFGSFHSSQQRNAGETTQHDQITHKILL